MTGPWVAVLASGELFGLAAWWRYEQGWQPGEGLASRRFWVEAAVPVFLFMVAAAAVTTVVTG